MQSIESDVKTLRKELSSHRKDKKKEESTVVFQLVLTEGECEGSHVQAHGPDLGSAKKVLIKVV